MRIIQLGSDLIQVFAHTEPITELVIPHLLSAMLGGADYRRGARILRRDLRAVGFDVVCKASQP